MGSDTPLHSVSVAAAIIQDGRILVIQRRDNGAWEPPGGILELEETITDGLRREVREETGLEITPTELTGVYKNMPRGIVALVFRCEKVSGGTIKATDETRDLRWLTPQQIRDMVREDRMTEAFAVRLLDALDNGAAHIRAHDGTHLITNRN